MEDLDADELAEMMKAAGVDPYEMVALLLEEFGKDIADLDEDDVIEWAMEEFDL